MEKRLLRNYLHDEIYWRLLRQAASEVSNCLRNIQKVQEPLNFICHNMKNVLKDELGSGYE